MRSSRSTSCKASWVFDRRNSAAWANIRFEVRSFCASSHRGWGTNRDEGCVRGSNEWRPVGSPHAGGSIAACPQSACDWLNWLGESDGFAKINPNESSAAPEVSRLMSRCGPRQIAVRRRGACGQSVFGDHHTYGSRRWCSWHPDSARRYRARLVSLVLSGICRRGADDPVWAGISAAEAARASLALPSQPRSLFTLMLVSWLCWIGAAPGAGVFIFFGTAAILLFFCSFRPCRSRNTAYVAGAGWESNRPDGTMRPVRKFAADCN